MSATANQGESSRFTLETFLRENSEKDAPGSLFEKESERLLRVDVAGSVLIKPGAAVAYRGDLEFERLSTLRAKGLKEMFKREMSPLTRVKGNGRLYCAHKGWHLRVVHLDGGSVFIISEFLLAFEETLQFEIQLVGHGLSVVASGLFAVKLSGNGKLAFAIHGDPLTMTVTPDRPVITDPHATLAWTADLEPELKTDLGWKELFEHGGGEPFQMVFRGNGHVVVQPSEDPGKFKWKPVSKLKSMIGL